MKTIKNRVSKTKFNKSNKTRRKMIGGVLDSSVISNTFNLFNDTVNYLQIDGTRKVYYTRISFRLPDRKNINDIINYGLNPGLGGSITDTSQPYIIYFFIYYYVSKIFSEFIKMIERSGKSDMALFILPDDSTGDVVVMKEINDRLEMNVDIRYCIIAKLSTIPSIITIGSKGTHIVIQFMIREFMSGNRIGTTLVDLIITGIFIINDNGDTPSDIISNLQRRSRTNNNYTPETNPYSSEVRGKIISIVLYALDIEKQLISSQSSKTELNFINLKEDRLIFRPLSYSRNEIPQQYQMSATFLTFINKVSDAIKGNLSSDVSSRNTRRMNVITENYIPNVINVYLSSPAYSQVKLDSILLKRSMFSPYNSSSGELQINPRYDFLKMKSLFTSQFCKSNKECYLDTLYSFSEFANFNQRNKMEQRLQTIDQVTPNVRGNIEATLSLILPNSTLKINGEEFVITDYDWNNQWKLTGPKDILLSIEPQYLQNKLMDGIADTEKCYKNIVEFYDELIELFLPSMSGKDITKIYGNYLKILNERNILLNSVKKFVNRKTLTIKTVDLSSEDKRVISEIRTKSTSLNDYINKFVESIFRQLIIIGNLTRKIVNKIHSPCFFYFGFDTDLYIFDDNNSQKQLKLSVIAKNISELIKGDDAKYKTTTYMDQYLETMYYSSPDEYNIFFDSLLCGTLTMDGYTSIIQSFSNIIKTVIEQLDKIADRMVEIKRDVSYETVNLSNETLSKLWISDASIEKAFGEFETKFRNFIKYNLVDGYYSKPMIEKWIDDILWDMDKSYDYTYCRLFTTFLHNNIWEQFELLFSFKILQYIFLIYQYTGKYIYYKHVQINSNIPDNFLVFLQTPKSFNLFSCVVNWFKYNCAFEIQKLYETKQDTSIAIRDIQKLFAENKCILFSYALMKYYITQIIITNLDVCQLTTDLQFFVDALAPNDGDLKSITPQSTNDPEKSNKYDETSEKNNGKDDRGKGNNKDNRGGNINNANTLSYDVEVQVRVKKVSAGSDPNEKLNSNNIYEYLGCKNRDLQFQMNKLKQTSGILMGDINGYISKQSVLLGGPNILKLKENISNGNQPDGVEYIVSLFYNPQSIQILSSVNLSENKGGGKTNFFVTVNKLVYNINKRTREVMDVKTDGIFLTEIKGQPQKDNKYFDIFSIFDKFDKSTLDVEE